MAINLFGNFNIGNNPYASQLTQGSEGVSVAQNNSQLLNMLKELLPGQTIDAKLVSQDNKALQLLVGDNTLLNTTLDSNSPLAVGQNIQFEVKSNNNGQLVLRPLNTNLSNDSTAVKALENASVKVSSETLKMVDTLMKEGMSVGRDMLQAINREMNLFPDADIKDIVLLHKFNIPVNESNINQMNLYNNNNQWMTANIENMSEDMTQAIIQSADNADELSTLVGKLEELFGDKEPAANAVEEENAKTLPSQQKDGAGQIKKDDIFDLLKNITPDKLSKKENVEMIKRELGEIISNKMLMNPEKVADKEYVKNYYDKIMDISKELENFLTQNSKGDTMLAKDMAGIKDNVNFMNQMNELYNYVQLPLKMAGNMAKGDLYVYSRKASKGERQADEPLTALLHLSMDTLGNMDIYLKLHQGKLFTDFSLEKEEMIDFIEAHIDELNSRLTEKGYNVNTTVGKLENPDRTVIDTIKSESPQITLLSNQSFDARA